MFDVVLNFAGIFSGCFGRTNDSSSDFHQLKMALNKADTKTKIQLLLARITNGKYHSSFLFNFTSENSFIITDYYGEEQHQVDSQLLCRNIPIMDRNKVISVLCIRSEKLKKIKIQQELIDLLIEVVINPD